MMASCESLHGTLDSLGGLLTRAASVWPRSGVRYFASDGINDSVVQTYPVLLDEALHLLGGLRARGLRPGDKVVLLLERPRDFISAFWGCVLGGYVPCPLAPSRADTSRWAAQLEHVTTLLDRPLLLTTKDVESDIPQVADVSITCLEELPASTPETTVHNAGKDDVALLMLTSGSTGNSKAAMLTHANLLASMAAKVERLELTARDNTMNWICFDHIAAVEFHLMPLYAGATQFHAEPQTILGDPLCFIRLIDAHRISVTFTPNFLLGQINKAMTQRPDDFWVELSSVRHIISGGEAIVCATARTFLDQWARFGLERDVLVPAFGMTETCAGSVFSTQFPDIDAGLEFASLGLPLPGLEMRIVDDNLPLPDGEVGDLQVRGPMVFGGYLNNQTATQTSFAADGWFRTGDRGTINMGRLALVGRSKDSIIVNGVNYYSHDLETVLEQLDGVEKSSVAAFPTRPPGSDTEQLVIVFSTCIPHDDEAALHRLLVAIRSSVVLHWGFRPELILPLAKSEIPKTSLGKIQRSQLRTRLESGEFAELTEHVATLTLRQLGGYVAPETETEIALAEIYAEMFGVEPRSISATARFFDLGGTSLEILRLKHNIEQRLGIQDLPVVSILRAPTVRGLARRLAAGHHPTADAYDPLVPLQTSGSKTPLFCVHPGVGEVLVFVNLATYFVNERPFYALRARGFGKNETHFTSFAEMVDCYVRAIRAEQPTGPYAIAGYSYGGVVAFEIAKELEAQGERVDFVGILNIPPHIKSRMHELDFVEGAVNLAFFLSLITKEQAAELPRRLRAGLSRHEQLEYLIEIAPKQRLTELDLDLHKFIAWVGLAESLVSLGRTYEPSGTVKSVSVFFANPLRGTKEDWLSTQLREWDNFTQEPNRYIDVPGEHYTLMGTTHVATFQDILRKELNRALDGK